MDKMNSHPNPNREGWIGDGVLASLGNAHPQQTSSTHHDDENQRPQAIREAPKASDHSGASSYAISPYQSNHRNVQAMKVEDLNGSHGTLGSVAGPRDHSKSTLQIITAHHPHSTTSTGTSQGSVAPLSGGPGTTFMTHTRTSMPSRLASSGSMRPPSTSDGSAIPVVRLGSTLYGSGSIAPKVELPLMGPPERPSRDVFFGDDERNFFTGLTLRTSSQGLSSTAALANPSSKSHGNSPCLNPSGNSAPEKGLASFAQTHQLPTRPAAMEANVISNRALDLYSRYMKPVPSQPRAMRTSATMVKTERVMESRKPATNLPLLRNVDLEKWPCRHCNFVHRGGECETSCIGCGSADYERHDLMCPYRGKIRIDEPVQTFVRREVKRDVRREEDVEHTRSFSRKFNDLLPQSATMRLSLECQKRGFNPEFIYYGRKEIGEFKADLYIKGVHISGNGVAHASQKDARDALSKKGLDVVYKMPADPDAARQLLRTRPMAKNEDGSFDKPALNAPTRVATAVDHGSSARQTEHRPITIEHTRSNPDAMDVDPPSVQIRRSPPNDRARLSLAPTKRRENGVDLPANVDPGVIEGMLKRAFSDSSASVTVNLPANVSAEVAQAYALGFGSLAVARRRVRPRSRSRSRSPVRDRPRNDRDYRERDNYPRSRTVIDEYRPARESGTRVRFEEDSRHRLSPQPASRRRVNVRDLIGRYPRRR